ncbi:HAD-IA family hydrolase [Streptomyces sp. NPDC049906]|uniref:HAD family hydrolase n=1 Tax=Streptomyces sp. NPDC049906 TaxID=3155656 RepID=UPI003417D442
MTELTDVLRPARHVLLDFDGPVCSVFAGLPAPEVARLLYGSLAKEVDDLPAAWADESDPFVLLHAVADEHPALTPLADAYLAQLEEEAVRVARPTPGAESLLHACRDTGRAVWVVSNNAGAAISEYLAAHQLHQLVAGVFGRVPGDPSSMKPNPQLLDDAIRAAGTTARACVFIGDAARDVEAGTAAGMPTIGYANKPHKPAKLATAGAAVVTDSMTVIARAVRDAGQIG